MDQVRQILNKSCLVPSVLGKNPGPGTYEALAGTSPRGKQFYSKFASSRASVFNPPRSGRFIDIGIV